MNKHYNQIKENAMQYGENIQAYNEYLNFIAYLIKVLGLPNNAISQSMILKLLTDKGLFSKDKNFCIKYGKGDDIVGFWGMHVIDGVASCRHIANFQSDVISRNYLYSEPFYCYMSHNNYQNLGNFSIDHAINLIIYNNVYYGYDASNNKLFRFIDGMKMEELFSDQPLFAYYKPELKLSQNGYEIAKVSYDLDLFKKMADMSPINFEEYKYITLCAQKMVCQNGELFESFHESSKKYIKRITKRNNIK